MLTLNKSINTQQNTVSLKAPIKISLTSNVESLTNGQNAILTFLFSSVPVGFTLNDISVSNGTVTNLIQNLTSPNIFTANFIGGVSNHSGMSTIKLDGIYTDVLGTNGTPSNTLTIKNLDSSTNNISSMPTVGFKSNNTSIMEGNSGITNMNFVIELSASSKENVTVNYTTFQKTYGTATINIDYIPLINSITFAPGEISKTISVEVIGDTVYESNESFYIDLISSKGATIVIKGAEGLRSSWSVGNIINDDIAPTPTVGFTSNNASIKEGNTGLTSMDFTVKLSASSTESITVNYTTELKTYGTAKANVDYIPVTGSIVFAPGETSKIIKVNVIGDTAYENNENFYLDLTSAKGATIVINGAEGLRNSWSVGNIINDDISTASTVEIKTNNTSIKEGIFGTTGKDVIGGTSASDYIYGKGGADIITGFAGNDTFVFSKINSSKLLIDAAQITDFKNGFDLIGLQDLSYNDLFIKQGTGLNKYDTVVSLDSNKILLVLIGINASTIDSNDFCNTL